MKLIHLKFVDVFFEFFLQVGSRSHNNRVVARSTTLLPNIVGLPAILTLLFAPRAELRADANRTRLTGAICGLGYDGKRKQSFYPEHDMELAFDSEIDFPVSVRCRFLTLLLKMFVSMFVFPSGCASHQ